MIALMLKTTLNQLFFKILVSSFRVGYLMTFLIQFFGGNTEQSFVRTLYGINPICFNTCVSRRKCVFRFKLYLLQCQVERNLILPRCIPLSRNLIRCLLQFYKGSLVTICELTVKLRRTRNRCTRSKLNHMIFFEIFEESNPDISEQRSGCFRLAF